MLFKNVTELIEMYNFVVETTCYYVNHHKYNIE